MSDTLPPKAESVDRQGRPDGFVPSSYYRPEVLHGGMTRLVVSVPMDQLESAFLSLVACVDAPFKVLYKQLTDRVQGIQLPQPVDRVAVEIPRDRLLDALRRYRGLVFHDGRHQLWIRGLNGEQVILDEVGQIFVYPDDFVFRDALAEKAVPEGDGQDIGARDYVRVRFDAAHDDEEEGLIRDLHLIPWQG